MDYWIIGVLSYDLLSPSLSIPLSPRLFLLTLSPHSNGYIRASLTAECTAVTFSIRLPDNVKISLAIDLFSDFDQGLWANDCTKPTSFASLLINFDF